MDIFVSSEPHHEILEEESFKFKVNTYAPMLDSEIILCKFSNNWY